MISTDPGKQFEASFDYGQPGQASQLQVQLVIPGEQRVVISRTNAGITEFPAGSGVYGVTLTAPLAPGLYVLIWDWAGSNPVDTTNTFVDQVTVVYQPPQWYLENEIVWPFGNFDGFIPGAQVSDAAPGSNPIPTAADVRAASNLSWTDYGAGLADDTGPAGLQEIVDRAESAFYNITGQTLDSIDVKFAPQVRRVIQGMTEQLAMAGSADVLDTQSDWDLITSFTAGPYSEQHRAGDEMFKGRMLFPVPWISMALWALLTPDRYGFWVSFFTGVNQPAFEGTDVFWEAGQELSSLYGPPGIGFWGGA
jgi:hypothetical protein